MLGEGNMEVGQVTLPKKIFFYHIPIQNSFQVWSYITHLNIFSRLRQTGMDGTQPNKLFSVQPCFT